MVCWDVLGGFGFVVLFYSWLGRGCVDITRERDNVYRKAAVLLACTPSLLPFFYMLNLFLKIKKVF